MKHFQIGSFEKGLLKEMCRKLWAVQQEITEVDATVAQGMKTESCY